MTAGGDMGHDVCVDVGDGDNGNNNAGNNADGCRWRGGRGLLAEDAAAVAVAAGTAAVVAAAYCRGRRECNIPAQKNGHKGVEKKP
jgi:hypothetical protein